MTNPNADIFALLTQPEVAAVCETDARVAKAAKIARFIYPALELYADDEAAFNVLSIAYAGLSKDARTQIGKCAGTHHPSPITMALAVKQMRDMAAAERAANAAEMTEMTDPVPALFYAADGADRLAAALRGVVETMMDEGIIR